LHRGFSASKITVCRKTTFSDSGPDAPHLFEKSGLAFAFDRRSGWT
jgi:hypothetical protein